MRVAVVANCQARPVAALLQSMCPKIAAVSTIIVHLGDASAQAHDYAMLDDMDVIFAQFVTDQYAVPHVATSRLKATFGQRVISWPNIYFRGQCPDLSYAAVGGTRRLMGPLRDYHLRTVHGCWKAGQSVDSCLALLGAPDEAYGDVLTEIAAGSLAEMRARETSLDIGIADTIEAEWRCRRLFFTFNHPTSFLLEAMAVRLLVAAGLTAAPLPEIRRTEPLGLIVPPVLRREADALPGVIPATDSCVGAEISGADGRLIIGRARPYAIRELIACYYDAYETQLNRDDEVRFTPR